MKLILIALFLFYCQTLTEYRDHTSLYSVDGIGITELNGENLQKILNYTPTLVIVEFYVSWCGSCKSFSSTYKSFEREIRNWGILVAAINCAHRMNAHVCDSVYNVYSYPTIKFFNCMENAGEKIHHDLAEIAKDRSIHSLRLATASLIVNQTKCPAITHSSYEFSQQFWEDFKSGMTRYNLMIVVIGTQNETRLVDSLSLDLRSCSRIFITLMDVKNPKLTLLFGSFSKPTLIAINRTIHIEIISDDFEEYNQIRSKLYSNNRNECPEINVFDTLISKPEFVAVNNETLNINLQKNEIYMTDLITGIGMSLRNELSRQPFDTSLIGIIKNWITIIRECMYWQKPQHEFLDNLYLWLISQGNSLTNSDWAAFMRSNEALNAFPTNQTWITCKGSDPTYRGYPCSLWLSFHIMTVKCERMSVSSTIGSTDVLLYIREYILNFFGCQECREHFDELTKHVFDKVHTDRDAILFLWNGHNMVNARLRSKDTADPFAPKIQFPSDYLCPNCQNIDSLTIDEIYISSPGYNLIPIKWNIHSVLNFLKIHYGPNNIRLSDEDHNIKNKDLYDSSVEFLKSLDNKRR